MGVITASNSTRRTRFKKQKNSGHAKKALQEDYKFSQNRKNKGLEAQRQPSVQPNTAKVTPVPRVQSEQEALPQVTKCKRISLTGNQASQISSKRANHAGNSLRHLRIPDLGCGGDLLPNGGGVPAFLDEQRNYGEEELHTLYNGCGEHSKHRKESLQGL